MQGRLQRDHRVDRVAVEKRDQLVAVALVYEFHDLGLPESEGAIAFGTSIIYAGKVGDEYFMTKGHFHTILATSEVYYCLRGHGYMLMENPEGDWEARELTPGCALYVPERYAHRSINVGSDAPLITFFAFRADAGHNYGAIETKGFRKRIVERNGKPGIIDVVVEFSDERRAIAFKKYLKSGSGCAFAQRHLR